MTGFEDSEPPWPFRSVSQQSGQRMPVFREFVAMPQKPAEESSLGKGLALRGVKRQPLPSDELTVCCVASDDDERSAIHPPGLTDQQASARSHWQR